MRRLLPALALGALVAAGCDGQPLPPDKSEFAGHWRGGGVDLVIQPEGQVEYVKVEGKGRREISGPIQGWKGDDFVVGVMVVKTTFKVEQPPHQDENGLWVMTVDSIELTRMPE